MDKVKAIMQKSEKDKAIIRWIESQPWGEKIKNQIAKRKIEEYRASLTMYKKGTMQLLNRIIDWLNKENK